MSARDLTKEISLDGKVFLVTGASNGIGKAVAARLASQGARVILACRSEERAQAAINDIRQQQPSAALDFLELDLASTASVRRCVDAFRGLGVPLHGLIANAGCTGLTEKTAEGLEPLFATNHLGHFLLCNLLIDDLRKTAPSRIVVVASEAYKFHGGPFDASDVDGVRSQGMAGFKLYGRSKLCNIYYVQELHRRLNSAAPSGVKVYAVHPGAVATDLGRNFRTNFVIRAIEKCLQWFFLTPEQSADIVLYPALSDQVDERSGEYFVNKKLTALKSWARDPEVAGQLWKLSEDLTNS
eukprot:TRINITY_DN8066_c0_g1_i1.p1 TRINITY_DN8066_c0_g1~~TRINITY_DN8066_c0_g1_i1.p1  ORF type:complete len:298 (+),score=74.50 TRINITY_DN8066_c0_g1_i1:403-1296(+)